MKDKYSRYCAEVMGYVLFKPEFSENYCIHENKADGVIVYNPYDDLNQMAEVVEKLIDVQRESKFAPLLHQAFAVFMTGESIKQAFRDFIISTMEKE